MLHQRKSLENVVFSRLLMFFSGLFKL